MSFVSRLSCQAVGQHSEGKATDLAIRSLRSAIRSSTLISLGSISSKPISGSRAMRPSMPRKRTSRLTSTASGEPGRNAGRLACVVGLGQERRRGGRSCCGASGLERLLHQPRHPSRRQKVLSNATETAAESAMLRAAIQLRRSAEDMGRASWQPGPSSQFSWRNHCQTSSVSMPSASTERPSLCPRAMTDSTIARSLLLSRRSARSRWHRSGHGSRSDAAARMGPTLTRRTEQAC
jgi:hypothetical protein